MVFDNIINNTLTSTVLCCFSFNKIKNPYTHIMFYKMRQCIEYIHFYFIIFLEVPKIFNKLMDSDFHYDMFY